MFSELYKIILALNVISCGYIHLLISVAQWHKMGLDPRPHILPRLSVLRLLLQDFLDFSLHSIPLGQISSLRDTMSSHSLHVSELAESRKFSFSHNIRLGRQIFDFKVLPCPPTYSPFESVPESSASYLQLQFCRHGFCFFCVWAWTSEPCGEQPWTASTWGRSQSGY